MLRARLLAWISLMSALAVAGSASALELRSPGGAPTLAVQVPDRAVVVGERRNAVFLVEHQLPYLMLSVEEGDVKDVMAGSSSALDEVAANFVNGIAKSGATATPPVAFGRTTIAGRAAYLYRTQATNTQGISITLELWIVAIDDAHAGFLSVAGNLGDSATAILEQAALHATLSN